MYTRTHTYAHTHTYTYAHTYAHAHTCTHRHTYTHAHMYTHLHVYTQTDRQRHTHTHRHTQTAHSFRLQRFSIYIPALCRTPGVNVQHPSVVSGSFILLSPCMFNYVITSQMSETGLLEVNMTLCKPSLFTIIYLLKSMVLYQSQKFECQSNVTRLKYKGKEITNINVTSYCYTLLTMINRCLK